MVKQFNPEKHDKVKSIWEKILSPLQNYDKVIPINVAEKWIHNWFSQDKYDHIFNRFTKQGLSPPKIQLKRDCTYKGYEHRLSKMTPCVWIPQENIITLCLSQMQNKVQLKQSIDRELLFSLKMLTNYRDNSKDQNVIMNLFESCYQSLGILQIPEDLRRAISKKCAKSNYYFRFYKRDKYLIDQQYRYIDKIINQMIQ